MKSYTYNFEKSVEEVLKAINREIEQNSFKGTITDKHIDIRRICTGYSRPTSYHLEADIIKTEDGCKLNGKFGYIKSWFIIAIVMAVIMFGYSAFMFIVFPQADIGKYLLIFSAIILLAYILMSFSKRKDVVNETEMIFKKINSEA